MRPQCTNNIHNRDTARRHLIRIHSNTDGTFTTSKDRNTGHATDCGDFVIILNADKAVLTGKKLEQKYYKYHTGYVGGLKEVKYDKLMAEKPEFAMTKAVKGMLPHNTLGAKALTRLRVYAGAEHDNAAQKPEAWTLEIK